MCEEPGVARPVIRKPPASNNMASGNVIAGAELDVPRLEFLNFQGEVARLYSHQHGFGSPSAVPTGISTGIRIDLRTLCKIR
jgi:hypothetical protein